MNSVIKGLGEVSIRANDLEAMSRFYETVVGLNVLRREKNFVFYNIAAGYGGHPQVLALFDATDHYLQENKSPTASANVTTLHHIAFNINLEDYESEKSRLETLGLKVHATEHAWLHVRSLYINDPEGNLLEFVCFDEGVW